MNIWEYIYVKFYKVRRPFKYNPHYPEFRQGKLR